MVLGKSQRRRSHCACPHRPALSSLYGLTFVVSAPAIPAGPKPRRTRGNGVKHASKSVRQYAALTTTFFKGSIAGQINSVFKAREITPQKASDYKQALADGACTLGNVSLSKSLIAKLQTLGIEVPATAD